MNHEQTDSRIHGGDGSQGRSVSETQTGDFQRESIQNAECSKRAINFKNIEQQRFGKLTAIEPVVVSKHILKWRCLCECGTVKLVSGTHLRLGRIKSCGCDSNRMKSVSKIRHGMAGTRTYNIWCSMFKRCYKPSESGYHNYGGKGIKVCERWNTFENFFADMGTCPDGLEIDRYPNRKGNYEPGNCRWATRKQNSWNKDGNRTITYNGVTKLCLEWSEELCCSTRVLYKRVFQRKWDLNRAMTQPFYKP